jgi:hypothetical protein
MVGWKKGQRAEQNRERVACLDVPSVVNMPCCCRQVLVRLWQGCWGLFIESLDILQLLEEREKRERERKKKRGVGCFTWLMKVGCKGNRPTPDEK